MRGGAREVGRDRFAGGGRSGGRLEGAWHEVTEKGRRGRIRWRVLAREEGDRAHMALLPAYGPVRRVPGRLRGAGRVGRLRARGLRSVGAEDGRALQRLLLRLPLRGHLRLPRGERALQGLHTVLARYLLLQAALLEESAGPGGDPRGEPRSGYALRASSQHPGVLPACVLPHGSWGVQDGIPLVRLRLDRLLPPRIGTVASLRAHRERQGLHPELLRPRRLFYGRPGPPRVDP